MQSFAKSKAETGIESPSVWDGLQALMMADQKGMEIMKMNKTLEIIIKKFAESTRHQSNVCNLWESAKEGTKAKELYYSAWREECANHWLLTQILKESGFTLEQIHMMEIDSLESKSE